MANYIGLVPVPGDRPLGEFIDELITKDTELLIVKLGELLATIQETKDSEQPEVFAYAKLMQYLSNTLPRPDLIHLCAAALWAINHEPETRSDGT